MWKMISVLIFTLNITGCDSAPVTEATFNNSENNHNFANPIKAGTLPNGETVVLSGRFTDGYLVIEDVE